MRRYHLAIFDFDGTLANSMPWFRASFQDMIARFDLAPVGADEIEGLRMMSARQVLARLNVPMWRLPIIVNDMRRRKLAAADEISLFDGVETLLAELQRLGIRTAIVSSDGEESVRRVLGPAASLISRFDCGAAIFGKHRKFRRVARHFRIAPTDTICIGDEIRDIEAARATGMDSGAVAWGYALPTALQAAGRPIFSGRWQRSRNGSRLQRPPSKTLVTSQAANEHELIHGPRDRLNRILFHGECIVEQRNVRSEIRVRHPPQASSQHRSAEHSAKRYQRLQTLVPYQHKRATATLAAKASSAVERNLERFNPHVRYGHAGCPDILFRQAAKKEQRHVQACRFDQFAAKTVRTFEDAG